MYILGLNLVHDTSAALIKDNIVIGAVEEERFNRQKHTNLFPKNAIKFLLRKEGISIDDIDYIVTSFDFSQFENNNEPFEHNTIFNDDESLTIEDNNLLYRNIKRNLQINGIYKFIGIPHHLAHAALAFYSSGYKKSNILIIDGRGERFSTSLMYGKGDEIEILEQYSIKDSLGHLYTYVTYLCGLYHTIGQEGKTMALAAFGERDPEMEELFNDIVKIVREKYIIDRTKMRMLERYRRNLGQIDEISKKLAYHVQKSYERVLLFLAEKMYNQTGVKNFVMAGGVALNCEANRKLLEAGFAEKLYIPNACNDAGTSLGAALYFAYKKLGIKVRIQEDTYLGPNFSNEEIEKVLVSFKIPYEKIDNPSKIGAKLLIDGKIIGWFQDKMEFGPRALGDRSILANPSTDGIKDKINKFVKYREPWRPFAPSILYDKMNTFFDFQYYSPNMTISFSVTKNKSKIKEAIHIDNTARIQTVKRDKNPLFYDLIYDFYEMTDIPALLNTSFNVKGEPIVCTPSDAIRTFFSSGLDALIIGNYLIQKFYIQKSYLSSKGGVK